MSGMDSMSEEEVIEALCMGEELSPQVRAIMQVLGDHIADATDLVSSFQVAESHGKLAHCAGGLQCLIAFREHLEAVIKEAKVKGN